MNKSVSLAGRFWDWVLSMSTQEAQYLAQETEVLRDYQRILSAEAELKELAVREAQARISVAEELKAQDLKDAEELKARFTAEAVAHFGLQWGNQDVKVLLSLEKNRAGYRRIKISSVTDSKTGGVIEKLGYGTLWKYLEAREEYIMWIKPWHDGTLSTKDLASVVPNNSLTAMKIVAPGNKR